MNMLYDRSKEPKGNKMEKSPYNRHAEKDTKKAFKATAKSIKPVAKDTNKTRRHEAKPTAVGVKIPKKGCPTGKQMKDMKSKGIRRVEQ